MAEVGTAAVRCVTCGSELPHEGAPCPACTPAAADEERIVETALHVAECPEGQKEECAPGPLWIRILLASVYLAVGAGCVYGSISFFDGDFATSSDWIFGAMAIALAFVALIGVKESLFPSTWTPE